MADGVTAEADEVTMEDVTSDETEAGSRRSATWLGRLSADHRKTGLLPLVLLALATALSLGTTSALGYGAARTGALVGTVLATALWVIWFNTGGRRDRGDLATAYLVGRVVLAAVLTVLNPFMAFFAFVGWFDGYGRLSRRWLAFVFVLTAVTLGGSQSGGLPPRNGGQWGLFAVLAVFNLGLAALFSHLAYKDMTLAAERVRTISALEQANERLADALAENERLHEQLVVTAREAGVTEERRRLAGEIHDTIAQGLAGIVTQLQAADLGAAPASARRHVERASALARESLDEARRSVRGLSPSALAGDALPDALKKVTLTWSERNEPATDFTITGTAEPLHPEVEATVLRVAQESLANVGKHAHAHRVGVTLSYMDDELVLDVRDDGVGFDPVAADVAGGFGIGGMRQRVERLAGSFRLETAVGTGTAVCVRLPSVPHA